MDHSKLWDQEELQHLDDSTGDGDQYSGYSDSGGQYSESGYGDSGGQYSESGYGDSGGQYSESGYGGGDESGEGQQGGDQQVPPPPIDSDFHAMLEENQTTLQAEQDSAGGADNEPIGVGGGADDESIGSFLPSLPICSKELGSAAVAAGKAFGAVDALLAEIAATEVGGFLALLPTAVKAVAYLNDMINKENAYLDCAGQYPDALGHRYAEKFRGWVQWAQQKVAELESWIAKYQR